MSKTEYSPSNLTETPLKHPLRASSAISQHEKRPMVMVSPYWQELCQKDAARFTKPNSLTSKLRGNPSQEQQQCSKEAEVAAALHYGMNPHDLSWGGPDPGYDLPKTPHYGDVKHTWPMCNYLIWPVDKVPVFYEKPFTHLILVRGPYEGRRYQLTGWCGKEWFYENKQIADEIHELDTGTWYVPFWRLNLVRK